MSSKKPLPHATAAQAAHLTALLSARDPAAAAELAGGAARHFARERRTRPAAPATPDAAVNPQGVASASAAREYLHREPTRSAVLNAFLNALGGEELVPAEVDVLNEHTLAPRLVELARRRLVAMLLATGKSDVGLVLATEMPPIANERAARLFMRQACHVRSNVGGGLGAVARDYAIHRRRSGAPEHDDHRASCIMATFAGQMTAMAEQLLGSHVRDDVRAELSLLTSQGSAPARRMRARDLRAPQEGDRRGDQPGTSTAARDVANLSRRPRRT